MSAPKNRPDGEHSYRADLPIGKISGTEWLISRSRGARRMVVGIRAVGVSVDGDLTLEEARDLAEALLEAAHVEETDDQLGGGP